jgi:hypothetical protein
LRQTQYDGYRQERVGAKLSRLFSLRRRLYLPDERFGKVIPVIGEHAVSFGEGNEALYPWLAQELASRFGVSGARVGATPTLSDVFREH